MRWTPELRQEFETRWNSGEKPAAIQVRMGLTPGQVAGASMRFNMHNDPTGDGQVLRADSPAVLFGRTKYPQQVSADYSTGVLKRGMDQRKLGPRVTKGKWRGMPIYSLTIEERATCPSDCAMFRACYGNNMRMARRFRHGFDLQIALWAELIELERSRRRAGWPGYVVRLHILGDFYSVDYVDFWRRALRAFPGLHVFGYTAWKPSTPIGRAVAGLRDDQWGRFAVRGSGAPTGPRTLVAEDAAAVPAGAIICPAQTGATRSCSTCGLCWADAAKDRPVAFLRH